MFANFGQFGGSDTPKARPFIFKFIESGVRILHQTLFKMYIKS